MSASTSGPLTDRESEIVRHLWRLRFLSGSQLAEFLFGGSAVSRSSRPVITRRLIRSLRRAGIVASTPQMIGGRVGGKLPPAYYLSAAGQRRAAALFAGASARRLKSSGTFLVRHALATADVVLAFARAAQAHANHELVTWESDREAAMPVAGSLLVPDGYLVYRVGARHLHALLEVDMGTEHVRAIEEKLRRYQELCRGGAWRERHPIWPYTLVVAETAPRATQLRVVTEAAFASVAARWSGIGPSFHFAALADVVGPGGPLGPIWQRPLSSGRVALLPDAVETGLAGREGATVSSASAVIDVSMPTLAPESGEAAD